MLQNIHEKIQGWFAWVIVGVISAVFALFGIQYYLNQGASDGPVVASVNGGKITQKQYMQAQRRIQQQLRGNHSAGSINSKQLRMLVLDQLISQRLLLSSAQKEGFQVDQNLVNSYLAAIPAMHEDGQFSWARFRQLAYVNGFSADEFYQSIADNLTMDQVEQGFGSTSFILPQEIQRTYSLMNQKRRFFYYKIHINPAMNHSVVTQQQLKQYYNENAREFVRPAKVKLDYVVLSPKGLQHMEKISPQQVRDYYQQNQAQFIHPASYQVDRILLPIVSSSDSSHVNSVRSKMNQVYHKLSSGMSFAQVNKSVLNGKALVQSNHWISQTTFDVTMISRIVKLGIHQLSKPIRTPQGYEIVRLIAKKPPSKKSFEDVKDIVQKTMQNRQIEALFSKKSEQLSDLSYTNPDSLSSIQHAMGLIVQHSGWIEKDSKHQAAGILSDAKIRNIIFSENFIQERNNSNPIELKNGDLVVVRIAKYVEQKVKDFSEVKAEIAGLVKKQMLNAKMAQLANDLATRVRKNDAIDLVKYSATKMPVELITRSSTKLSSNMVEQVFSLDLANPVAALDLGNDSYAVIKLTSIDSNSVVPTSASLKKLRQKLSREKNTEIYKLYVDGLRKSARINIRSSTADQPAG